MNLSLASCVMMLPFQELLSSDCADYFADYALDIIYIFRLIPYSLCRLYAGGN